MTTLDELLRDLYQSEINIQISTFFGEGYRVKFCDHIYGFYALETFSTLEDTIQYIKRKAKFLYPDSFFTQKHEGIL